MAVVDIHLPVEAGRLVHADKAFDLLDQQHGLALADEIRRLHRVRQQAHLRRLKGAGGQEEAVLRRAGLDDIHAVVRQDLHVLVDGFPFAFDPVPLEQQGSQLRGIEDMLLIRILFKDLLEIQQLELGVRFACHKRTLPIHFLVP